ncbi:MAG: hypothetical protein ACRD9Q_08905 [Nitrososphaeraceae archaeon]
MSEPKETKNIEPPKLWYLIPIFMGVIGGLIMYLILKDQNEKMAKNGLYLGIILTVIIVVFYIISMAASFRQSELVQEEQRTVTISEYCGMVNDVSHGTKVENLPKSQYGHGDVYNTCMNNYKGVTHLEIDESVIQCLLKLEKAGIQGMTYTTDKCSITLGIIP